LKIKTWYSRILQNVFERLTQNIPNKGVSCQRAYSSAGHTSAPNPRRFHLAWVLGFVCASGHDGVVDASRFVLLRVADGLWSTNLRLPEDRGGRWSPSPSFGWRLTALRMTCVEMRDWQGSPHLLLPVFSNLRRLLRWFYGLRIVCRGRLNAL
jgi:hypothetical protein